MIFSQNVYDSCNQMTNIGLKALEEKIKDHLPNVKQLSLDFSGYDF